MSKVSTPGHLFIHSGVFDKTQIEASLRWCIEQLDLEQCNIYVNVVEDKSGHKFGHTYAWVSDVRVYNALIGNNLDGSPRVLEIDDPDWHPPTVPLEEALKEAKGNWGDEAEIEERYEQPVIQKQLPPLVVPPGIMYTPEQQKELNTTDEVGFIEVFMTRVTIRSDDMRTNSIYSTDVPSWINPKILRSFFGRFGIDKTVHFDSRSKRKIEYPVVEISKSKNNINAQITFSPMDKYLSHFIMKICKKITIKNPSTEESAMIFFSQSKKPKRLNY
jgi:hypothetical protein